MRIEDEIIRELKVIAEENFVIEDIYLYGSYVRGEADEYSDIDILIVINNEEYNNIINMKDLISRRVDIPKEWISIYTISKIEEMKLYGAYFLWHLKLEGEKIYSRKKYLKNVLEILPQYKKCRNDLSQYQEICIDIEQEIKNKKYNIYYELNVLASIVRNASIAFCFLKGVYIFGRIEPVRFVKNYIDNESGSNINIDISEYNELYKYRIIYNRGGKYTNKNDLKVFLLKWLNIANYIISLGVNILSEGDVNERKYIE